VLLASALKLFGLPTLVVGVAAATAVAAGTAAGLRRRLTARRPTTRRVALPQVD